MSRYERPAVETKEHRGARCVAVARRQASQGKPLRVFVAGEMLGKYEFAGHVGDNPAGQYINIKCVNGHLIAIRKDNISQVSRQVGFCKSCSRAERKAYLETL